MTPWTPRPGRSGPGTRPGQTIQFTLEGGKEAPLRMTRVAGMIFNQQRRRRSRRPICKVIDADGNELVAAAVARTARGTR